jgi:hypothetical protein
MNRLKNRLDAVEDRNPILPRRARSVERYPYAETLAHVLRPLLRDQLDDALDAANDLLRLASEKDDAEAQHADLILDLLTCAPWIDAGAFMHWGEAAEPHVRAWVDGNRTADGTDDPDALTLAIPAPPEPVGTVPPTLTDGPGRAYAAARCALNRHEGFTPWNGALPTDTRTATLYLLRLWFGYAEGAAKVHALHASKAEPTP